MLQLPEVQRTLRQGFAFGLVQLPSDVDEPGREERKARGQKGRVHIKPSARGPKTRWEQVGATDWGRVRVSGPAEADSSLTEPPASRDVTRSFMGLCCSHTVPLLLGWKQ